MHNGYNYRVNFHHETFHQELLLKVIVQVTEMKWP